MATAVAQELLGRGVHPASYRVRGHPVLLAIASNGERLGSVRLSPDVNETIARAYLQGLVDHYDPERPPRPPLRLVNPSRPAPPPWRFYIPPLRRLAFLRRETRIP